VTELEAIIAADEESRARLAFAEEKRGRDVAAARGEHDRAAEERRRSSCDELDTELAAIRDETDRELANLRESRQLSLAALAGAGERQLERAAELYAQIVGGLA
jgi:hypothetical protein